jgi:hypothetical protein
MSGRFERTGAAVAELRAAMRAELPADLAVEGCAALLFVAGLVRQAELRGMPVREVEEMARVFEGMVIGDRLR